MLNSFKDFAITLVTQYPWPHHALSRIMFALTRARFKLWKNWQIKWFIRRYQVDMSIVEQPDPKAYENFNHFFTRTLLPEARPVVSNPGEIASPVDGVVSQVGEIIDGQLLQAKGHAFDVDALLGGSRRRAAPFQGGHFATLYLSPKDYHRIHMPTSGELREMVHVPGRLFSVSPRTTRTIPNLFGRNERAVALFNTELGPMAMVLVGAMFVGSIETVWAGTMVPRRGKMVQVWDYTFRHKQNPPIVLDRGEEMGRFNMGSTVIVLFGPGAIQWAPTIQPDAGVKMGHLLALGLIKS